MPLHIMPKPDVVYWACSTSKVSGHKSRVGPFEAAYLALNWLDENRPEENWENVHVDCALREKTE